MTIVHVDCDFVASFVVKIHLQVHEDTYTLTKTFRSLDAFLGHQHFPLEGISHCQIGDLDEAVLSELLKFVGTILDELFNVVYKRDHIPELLLEDF